MKAFDFDFDFVLMFRRKEVDRIESKRRRISLLSGEGKPSFQAHQHNDDSSLSLVGLGSQTWK
jgi:hypothetical protein